VGANANRNANTNFNGVRQNPFFTDPGARQQLNMNDNQFNTLNRAYQQAYDRYNQSVNGLNSSLTEQQRQAQMQQFGTQFNDDLNGSLNSTFSDPQQRARYDQLNRQFSGLDAFNDSAIQQQMNLTPQQQQQLRQLAAQWRDQMNQFGSGGNVDTNQWSQMSSQYYDQLNSMLTPEQQDTWRQLTGERHNFPPSVYFDADAAQGNAGNPQLPTRRSNRGSVNNRGTVGTPVNPGSGFAPEGRSGQGNATSGSGTTPGATTDGGTRGGSSNSANRGSGATR
jgi:hypothetical protein